LDGVQFTALDLMQNRLTRTPESLRGQIQWQVVLGDVGHEPRPDLGCDADPPGRVRGRLLGREQPGPQPSIDRRLCDAEFARCLLDREDAAVGVRWWRRCDVVLLADVLDAWLGEQQAGAGAAALLVEDRCDLVVRVMLGEPADQLDSVLGCAGPFRATALEPDL
jgi:hypothetical protein